ncbi:MAG: hypothetical protein WHZ52_14315 [Armatimonadota bacterium]
MGTTRRLSIVLMALSVLAPAIGRADIPAPFTGSRSSSNAAQIFATDGWANGGFSITWSISQTGTVFEYTYTIRQDTGAPLSKGLSHLLLEVSDAFGTADIWDLSGASLNGIATIVPPHHGNPGLPATIYAMELDTNGSTTPTIKFKSTRAPVWGDFYAKDGTDAGSDVYAYNKDFGKDPASFADFSGFIARPDTRPIIPEPVFFQLGALVGLGGLGMLRMRRRG